MNSLWSEFYPKLTSFRRLWNGLILLILGLLAFYLLSAGLIKSELNAYRFEKYFLTNLFLILPLSCFLYLDIIFHFLRKHFGLILVLALLEIPSLIFHQNTFLLKKIIVDICFALIFFVLLDEFQKDSRVKYVFYAVCLYIMILSLPIPISANGIWHHEGTYKANYIHRNALGFFLIPTFILLATSRLSTKIKLVVSSYTMLVMFLSVSRTWWMASIIITPLILLKYSRKFYVALTILLHILIFIVWRITGGDPTFGFFSFKQKDLSFMQKHLSFMPNERVFETSSDERTQILVSGFKKFLEVPFWGTGNVFTVDSTYTKSLDILNLLLANLVSYGIFSTAVGVYIFYKLYMKAHYRTRLLLISFVVFSSFQSFFNFLQTGYTFFFILALMAFVYLDKQEPA